MTTRTCKTCSKVKEYTYIGLNTQGRSVYKDVAGIWHGRSCHDCHLDYVKKIADKTPLTFKECSNCKKEFFQNSVRHRFCNKFCKESFFLSKDVSA